MSQGFFAKFAQFGIMAATSSSGVDLAKRGRREQTPVVPREGKIPVGIRLRALRRHRGTDLKTVAEAIDYAENTISQAETGSVPVSNVLLEAMCSFFQYPKDKLLSLPREVIDGWLVPGGQPLSGTDETDNTSIPAELEPVTVDPGLLRAAEPPTGRWVADNAADVFGAGTLPAPTSLSDVADLAPFERELRKLMGAYQLPYGARTAVQQKILDYARDALRAQRWELDQKEGSRP